MTEWPALLLRSRYVVFMGWMLLVLLWETTGVAVLLAAVRAWTRGRGVRREYAIALLAFATCVALTAAAPLALAWQNRGLARTSVLFARDTSLTASVPNSAALDRLLQVPAIDAVAAVAATLWAVGVLVLLVRLLGGWWLARSIVARARPIADEGARRTADELAARAGVKRRIHVAESAAVESPVVVGWRTPTLVLPYAAVYRLSPGQMSAVIAHEVAHVRRHDYAINLVQSIAEAPLFFSPSVAWISRRVREAREFCCDDEAVANIGDKRHYVQALVALAVPQTRLAVRPALGISGPRLITRVRRLLQEEPMPRLNPARIVALAGVLVLIVVSGVEISAASARRFPRQSDTTVYDTGHGVTSPVLLHEVKPEYTDSAKKRKVQGTVELQEVVTTEGPVRDIRVTRSLDPDLDAQAVKAAQQWRFRPGTKDGKPVNVRIIVELAFTLR